MPNAFITIAPAEWNALLHNGVFANVTKAEDLSGCQTQLTLHLYHVLTTVFEQVIFAKDSPAGFKKVFQYTIRIEFQDRGTLHVHVLVWCLFEDKFSLDGNAPSLSGKTGGKRPSNPQLLEFLEKVFNARVDVQTENGHHNFLKYVTSYETKASDALQFKRKESEAQNQSDWRQVYRLLCKKAPLEPEMAIEFATKPLILTSFRGAHLYAPLPKPASALDPETKSNAQRLYDAYLDRNLHSIIDIARLGEASQQRNGSLSFIEWARVHKLNEHNQVIRAKPERGVGSNKHMLALAIRFPFELLDNYVGAWCAMFIPHARFSFALSECVKSGCEEISEEKLWKSKEAALGTQYLKAALNHKDGITFETKSMQQPGLLQAMVRDLTIRGIPQNRIKTFMSRMRAYKMLLDRIDSEADIQFKKDLIKKWDYKRVVHLEDKIWSPQQKDVRAAVMNGVQIADANVSPHSRFLLVTGGPGTGKTEIVIQCAIDAAREGMKVLIACPIGALVAVYRQRLPPDLDITVETIHSSFKITRKADQQYVPPGRLRHFDLLIFDESSQPDDPVWTEMRTALLELSPGPFVVFVGDFQQLQPIQGVSRMRKTLFEQVDKGLFRHIQLQQHEFARCNDCVMLDFLTKARTYQPLKRDIEDFFRGRIWKKDLRIATAKSIILESESSKLFTFLTVTNKAARDISLERLRIEYNITKEMLEEVGVPGDSEGGGGNMIFRVGMRIRLTRNLDKDKGFVNGAIGNIEEILSDNDAAPVFTLKTADNIRLLVHYIFMEGLKFMPCTYGYAITIRRAQGITLDLGGLWFDKPKADRGYAYVAASRFRSANLVYHIGNVRRTDWLPVGGNAEHEQVELSIDSDSDANTADEDQDDLDFESQSDYEEDIDDDFNENLVALEEDKDSNQMAFCIAALFED